MQEQLVRWLSEHCARLADIRQPSPNLKYSLLDTILRAFSGFSVFFMHQFAFEGRIPCPLHCGQR